MLGKRGRRRGAWHWSRLLCAHAPHHSQRRETIIGKDGTFSKPLPHPQCQASSSKATPPKSFQAMPSPTGTECSNAQNYREHCLFKLLQCNEPGFAHFAQGCLDWDWNIAQLMNVCTGPWASHPASHKPGVVAHTWQEELKAKVTFTCIISSKPALAT